MNISVNTRTAFISPGVRFDLERRLGRMYRKAAGSIQRINVNLEDVNGPKGGVDKQCKVKVTLFGLPSILITTTRDSTEKAFVDALQKVNQTLFRKLKKHNRVRRATPLLDVTEEANEAKLVV
ncbi:hypothetical protein A3740_12955 [Oleiphilus sp. HI0068]|uniref:hypothetical protein n=1 Tax=Oleiphilus sp. HI0132 TaxID=1822270 RepID=UPI0007CFCF28|nr:hypothetical protein [Oleiphilus sp. HI0132]KZY76386.1 hypothetical protein A3740_12955 [Oleiphilus sp. HI0068]KZY76785.1 hypothetical protein A3741_10685 [Oleiphilus sp. HI0069]